MEAKREKALLKTVLRKLFVGLIFCFMVLGGSMITGTATVKADIYKTLSFDIYSGEPLDIGFPGYDDKKDGTPEVANWNSYGNRGTIISTGGRTPIKTGPDAGRYKYTITMNKVNVTGKTPWLKIKVKNNSDCIAQSFGFSDTKQSPGLSSSNGSPHYTGDKYKNDGDSLLVYMGLAFAETRIDARIGYDLTIAYNGATTKPTGGASSIKSDGTAATWKGYFHRHHYRADMPYYNDSGAIPGIFGSGDIKKKG